MEDDLGSPESSGSEALASVGADLDEVRERVEDPFGPGALENTRAAGLRRRRRWGHIPFDRGAKKVLEQALARSDPPGRTDDRTEHVLLGMLHRESGHAATILHARGITLDRMRAALDDGAPGAASG